MTEGIPIVRMYTDSSGHTRFAKMQIPIEPKVGLGSVGSFSSLLVNKNLGDNSGDVKTQFAVTPVPENVEGEGPKLAHTAPRRQLVLSLSGCLEFKSCGVDSDDSEHKVVIRRGDILLAEDLEGEGHVKLSDRSYFLSARTTSSLETPLPCLSPALQPPL